MATHTVRPGDCLSKLAADHGFSDYRVIYNHPNNAELKKKRPNPHVIKPGDQIFIPERDTNVAECPTGKVHSFQVKLPRAKIHVYIRDAGVPYGNKKYKLSVGRRVVSGKTDKEGLVEASVPAKATEATLTFEDDKLVFHLRLGNLDPLKEVSGVKGRLNNLGFFCGSGDDVDAETEEAIRRFQEHHGMDVSGEIDDFMREKLRELHDHGEES